MAAERPAPGLRKSRTGKTPIALAPERPSTCLRLSIRALMTLREAALGPVQPLRPHQQASISFSEVAEAPQRLRAFQSSGAFLAFL
jgi:hypothetical protein